MATARALVEADTDHLDVIVNLAGIYIMDSLVEVPEEDFLRMFDINVNGAYRVNKEFFPLVKDGGRIIIITRRAFPSRPAALQRHIQHHEGDPGDLHSLRLELALIDVPVITIRPGAVATKLLGDSFSSMERMVRKDQALQDECRKIPSHHEKSFRQAHATGKTGRDDIPRRSLTPSQGVLRRGCWTRATSVLGTARQHPGGAAEKAAEIEEK